MLCPKQWLKKKKTGLRNFPLVKTKFSECVVVGAGREAKEDTFPNFVVGIFVVAHQIAVPAGTLS